MSLLSSTLVPMSGLVLAPLLPAIINRVKARVAGRQGAPLLQPYLDIAKLLRKGAVYSTTTTWLFRAGPVASLATALVALLIVPLGGVAAPIHFTGDLIVVAGLFGVGRFLTVLAALDTGSAFEGMGASREVTFAALVEPALFLALASIVGTTHMGSLSTAYRALTPALWGEAAPALALVAATLLVIYLVENARIPVDDPTTHLELTMIHEVMVLDHSGVDLAFIEYGAALKLWLLGLLLVGLVVPVRTGNLLLDGGAAIAGLAGLAVMVGLIESSMARLRLNNVPALIVGGGVLSAVAFVVGMKP
jgi:formate hydrogenlyase subunit 4